MQRRQLSQSAATLNVPTLAFPVPCPERCSRQRHGVPGAALQTDRRVPGGPTDITMRLPADNASKILGQPVVIENKPDAAETLPAQTLQSTSADGYPLAQIPLGVFCLPYTAKSTWHPVKDLAYVLLNFTGCAFGLVVSSDSLLKSRTHFVGWEKALVEKLGLAKQS